MSKLWKPALSQLEAGVDGLRVEDVKDETKVIITRAHHDFKEHEVPVTTPIVHSATYRINSVQHYTNILQEGGYIYVRLNNPTCEAVEVTMKLLERGAGSVVFGSGMAAISTSLLSFLKAGDHVVSCASIYSGSYDFLKYHLTPFNIDVTFTANNVSDIKKAIKPNTKVVYGESPSNPHFTVLDMEEFGKLGKTYNLTTILDATCSSPVIIKPIEYGVDVVVHSGTKFLGGHSDLCAGVATTRTEDQWRKIFINRRAYGGILSPFEASLLLRGLKTLPIRVERECNNAQRLAEFLSGHPGVERVHYPGLKSHPDHELAKKQMRKFGAMISFDVKGGVEPAKVLVQSLRIIQLAVSLGGVDSLISHPASMTHGPMIMTQEERNEHGIGDGQIRFSVGVEDIDDLINDLRQGLDKAMAVTA
jgi:methionine-gamma-lyase